MNKKKTALLPEMQKKISKLVKLEDSHEVFSQRSKANEQSSGPAVQIKKFNTFQMRTVQ